jgi:hypothetical protein
MIGGQTVAGMAFRTRSPTPEKKAEILVIDGSAVTVAHHRPGAGRCLRGAATR